MCWCIDPVATYRSQNWTGIFPLRLTLGHDAGAIPITNWGPSLGRLYSSDNYESVKCATNNAKSYWVAIV